MSAIEVERDAGFAARAGVCAVMIDGLRRGEVRHGQRLTFEVSPGVHMVRLSVDGAECAPVKVFVGLGTTRLRCQTRMRLGLGPITLTAGRTRVLVEEERVALSERDLMPVPAQGVLPVAGHQASFAS